METPLELAPRLGRTFGAQLPEQITQMFDDVRYGSRSPTEAEVQTTARRVGRVAEVATSYQLRAIS